MEFLQLVWALFPVFNHSSDGRNFSLHLTGISHLTRVCSQVGKALTISSTPHHQVVKDLLFHEAYKRCSLSQLAGSSELYFTDCHKKPHKKPNQNASGIQQCNCLSALHIPTPSPVFPSLVFEEQCSCLTLKKA